MNYENKYINYVITYLQPRAPIYIHKTTYKKKWQNILNKESESFLISWPNFNDKQSTEWRDSNGKVIAKVNKTEAKYLNKRKSQFLMFAKLLINNNDFNTAITNLLEKWQLKNIVYGFSSTSFYDSEYRDTILSLWKCVLSFLDFQKILRDKRVVLNLNNKNQKKEYLTNLPSERFYKDIEKLMDSFSLSQIWEDPIILLLLTGYFPLPINFCPILLKIENNKPNLYIPIYLETQIEDIKYKWDEIKELKEEIFGKNRTKPSKDLDNFLDIYLEKENTGLTDRELIDFEELKVPDGVIFENRAFERYRKGKQNIKKLLENIGKTKLNNPQYVKKFADITGIKSNLFIF